MDLAEFLLARIAEDEAVARAAGHWFGFRLWDSTTDPDGVTIYEKGGDNAIATTVGPGEEGRAFADHVLAHQPGRVLAECDAKRRIVANYLGSRNGTAKITDPIKQMLGEAMTLAHGDALNALALPYAAHPDYNPEWKP